MVKIYIADAMELKDEQRYQRLYNGLDIDRRQKTDRLLFAKDQRLSVAAGALLTYALRQEQIFTPSIDVMPNGKPYLTGEEGVYFNLSHSEERVMCAVSDQEVGCDVEKKAVLERSVAEYVMTEAELRQIYDFDAEDRQQDMFFRYWTLKESYMKATGLGLSLEPRQFAVLDGKVKWNGITPADKREFYFKEFDLNDGYCYSCCSLSEQFCDTMTEVSFESFTME